MKDQKLNKIHVRISPKIAILVLVFFWGLSIVGTWFIAQKVHFQGDKTFSLLNPRLESLGLDTSEKRRAKLFTSLFPLKQEEIIFLGDKKDNAAFYVEDLNSGGWIGWKERDPFIPASLLKVPIAISVMKKVDEGDWALTTTFQMESKYKDKYFGKLWETPDGTSMTIEQLMKEMIQNSDNTATRIFLDKLTSQEKDDVYYQIGMANPKTSSKDDPTKPLFSEFSPKDLATVFRALYNATYLTRESSNYILQTLTETKFDDVVPTEIPSDIKIAHKIGNYFNPDPARPKQYHDCGITYLPDHNYLYCVMTKGLEPKDAEQIITGISDRVYLYFNKNGKVE